MKKILMLLGHPHPEKSYANTAIMEAFMKQLDEGEKKNVEIRNLIELYPDYRIDVKAEQEALLRADVIVLQFPFYWYSVPGIMKLWIDDVLEYGFAYGSSGDKLHGKHFLLSFTAWWPSEAYATTGYNNFEIPDLLKPLIQTSNLIGTQYHEPIHTHSMNFIPWVWNTKEAIEEGASSHTEKLIAVLRQI